MDSYYDRPRSTLGQAILRLAAEYLEDHRLLMDPAAASYERQHVLDLLSLVGQAEEEHEGSGRQLYVCLGALGKTKCSRVVDVSVHDHICPVCKGEVVLDDGVGLMKAHHAQVRSRIEQLRAEAAAL